VSESKRSKSWRVIWREAELESLESGSAKQRARSKLQESKRRIARKR